MFAGDWTFCKIGYLQNPRIYDCECDKASKISEYLDIENSACKKRLFGKLVLACENEILSTTETTPIVDKKVIQEKYQYLIHTISLIIICSLLVVAIFMNCQFYYTKHYLRDKNVLPYEQYK